MWLSEVKQGTYQPSKWKISYSEEMWFEETKGKHKKVYEQFCLLAV